MNWKKKKPSRIIEISMRRTITSKYLGRNTAGTFKPTQYSSLSSHMCCMGNRVFFCGRSVSLRKILFKMDNKPK